MNMTDRQTDRQDQKHHHARLK